MRRFYVASPQIPFLHKDIIPPGLSKNVLQIIREAETLLTDILQLTSNILALLRVLLNVVLIIIISQ